MPGPSHTSSSSAAPLAPAVLKAHAQLAAGTKGRQTGDLTDVQREVIALHCSSRMARHILDRAGVEGADLIGH